MREIQLTNESIEAPIRVFEKALAGHHKLGIIRLNTPASLNALSLQMIELMSQQLQVWKDDEAIVAVWLEGEGERAFCAGGNVVEVYESVVAERPNPAVVEDYFKKEYALDFCLHTYPKPVICWGQGIVMGGGMGLFMAADIRVVTETSRLAMPEIAIGLFPDVGASYFLNQIDVSWSRFIALTACHLSCSDAIALGLANVLVSQEVKQEVLEKLEMVHWDVQNKEQSLVSLKQVILSISQQHDAFNHNVDNHVSEHSAEIAPLMTDSIEEIDQKIRQWQPETAWLKKAKQSFLSGSALSAHVILRQLEAHRQSSLQEVFESELNLVTALCHKGDFAEGVRALLVDKDKAPKWRFSSVNTVSLEDVEQFSPSLNEAQLQERPILTTQNDLV
ncbi:enoyl-CoA hydratase/isomerase family protein [Marinomonas posidonica]|uniref:3-hydroxyisobutyryl-CoA hydrolase n=1 Tax=Marinomonas posidonica (strain CECT 7376 / NCIMB 14433 / IVIA-Po-181) TaxID=491952 RepID=F6CWA7_MARPP|nr:enoyl-CoA hydratase/isomerase family protein [Marinomonas posidonica]AEF55468.1 3-hydroxyisobutyryl-CoA hydrolase [Marinomonas posidonica IVIA-Po-181]